MRHQSLLYNGTFFNPFSRRERRQYTRDSKVYHSFVALLKSTFKTVTDLMKYPKLIGTVPVCPSNNHDTNFQEKVLQSSERFPQESNLCSLLSVYFPHLPQGFQFLWRRWIISTGWGVRTSSDQLTNARIQVVLLEHVVCVFQTQDLQKEL